MEEQILFYRHVIDSQLALRSKLQVDHATTPGNVHTIPVLLDLIDEQVRLLNQLINDLQALYQ